jgi:copper chaperone CopZ
MQNVSAPTVSAAVETAEIALPITGMTCASCVNRIDRFLRKADGVLWSSGLKTCPAEIKLSRHENGVIIGFGNEWLRRLIETF